MQVPDSSTASDVKFDKRVAVLEEKLHLIVNVNHLGISGSKGNSTPENTGNTTIIGSLVSCATGLLSGIDVIGPSGTDVNWPSMYKLTTGVSSAGSGSEWARLSTTLAGSQLDVKQGSPTTVPRPPHRVLRGSRRDDDSSRSMKVQAVARR